MYSSTDRPAFHKSSHSANESACVEVAEGAETLVRDSKQPELGQLPFPAAEWAAFLRTAEA
ncbi:DUF397 domain-containing protein [Nocardiopsis changdeensis]|uniref:DUF397 domain-containing protein n=1 Tax=Nocardiopsis changdeensis TaxID=2831969 RepID=A0ABX8BHK3_9ACTN|nr:MULTISPECIES: DUF397 domain-containing protein [Nocardiopsis]QUX20853.1 DUF397 domain-containing protein [Nocardiopsis changdeensis]QYX36785.1 DUF397 domain-containing protein [Nocardiopsis sp. MT53]